VREGDEMGFFKLLFGARSTSAEDSFNRGTVYSRERKYDKAIAAFSEAIRLDPKCAGAYSNRGHAYFAKSEYDQAIADCSEALRLNPQNEGAYFLRGWSYSQIRQPAKAIPDFTQVIRRAPGHAGAYHLRGLCHANLGDQENAVADFVEVARLDRKLLTPRSEPEWLIRLFAKAEKLFEESRHGGGSEGTPSPSC
jgi:tetratricopeptide (TPR) repeat protein